MSAFEKQAIQLKPISIMSLFLMVCGGSFCVFQAERGHLSQLQPRQRMDSLPWTVSRGKHESRGHQWNKGPWNPAMPYICLLGICNNAYDDTQSLGSLVPKATQKQEQAGTDAVQCHILARRKDCLCSFSSRNNYGEQLLLDPTVWVYLNTLPTSRRQSLVPELGFNTFLVMAKSSLRSKEVHSTSYILRAWAWA